MALAMLVRLFGSAFLYHLDFNVQPLSNGQFETPLFIKKDRAWVDLAGERFHFQDTNFDFFLINIGKRIVYSAYWKII